MRKAFLALAAAALFADASSARAGLETFDFSVTATSGSLSGTSATGSFSFDSSIIPAGGGEVDNTGLLTSLAFTWDGIVYAAATANTGMLTFDATGALVGAIFGNSCHIGGCGTTGGQEQWTVEWLRQSDFFSNDYFFFFYATPGYPFVGNGPASISSTSAVPEPASLALFATVLLGLGWLRRGQRA